MRDLYASHAAALRDVLRGRGKRRAASIMQRRALMPCCAKRASWPMRRPPPTTQRTHGPRDVAGLSGRATTREITAGASPNPKDEIRAVVQALNKTAAQARTGASRAVRDSGYNIKASAIDRSFTIERASR